MSQTTEIQIQNQAGLPFRQKMNLMLSALNTSFAGTTEPAVTEAYMNWLDTSVTPNVLKRRNAGDTAFEVHPLQSLADSTKITAEAAMPKAGGNYTGPANANKGVDIASAATTDIASTTGEYVTVTGTTTITALGTAQAGTMREVVFSGSLVLTHNATSLILPTGANITTAAGDCATFRSEGVGNWRCVKYQRANGTSVAGDVTNQRMLLTSPVSAAGTAIDFTGIPSWAKRVSIVLDGVSTNGTSLLLLRVGSGTVQTTGYASQAWSGAGTGVITTGFVVSASSGAANLQTSNAVLQLLGSNTWICAGNSALVSATSTGSSFAGKSPSLSGVLDTVRLTTVNGTDTFDAGSVSLLIEGY